MAMSGLLRIPREWGAAAVGIKTAGVEY